MTDTITATDTITTPKRADLELPRVRELLERLDAIPGGSGLHREAARLRNVLEAAEQLGKALDAGERLAPRWNAPGFEADVAAMTPADAGEAAKALCFVPDCAEAFGSALAGAAGVPETLACYVFGRSVDLDALETELRGATGFAWGCEDRSATAIGVLLARAGILAC